MKMRPRFKAVFFDAGGTLFEPNPPVGVTYAETARKFGCHVSADELETRFRNEWEKKDQNPHLHGPVMERQWWYDLVKEVFDPFGGVPQFEDFFSELHDLFARPDYWQLFPEVDGVLQKLKSQGVVLGIVSNWDSRLLPLCEKVGIHDHFDFILASGIVGSSKPDPGIFQEALRRSQAAPHEAIHVGDSLKDDIQGSHRVGINAVLVDRSGRRKYPVPTIDNLKNLLPLVL